MTEQHFDYQFEWDPLKARLNARKHGVSFERAAGVFLDPNALSIYDERHSLKEERWITLGLDQSGALIVVCHTFKDVDKLSGPSIRIISARKATKKEIEQYKEN